MITRDRTPWWLIAMAIILSLPVFQEPMLLSAAPAEPPIVRTLVYIYPIYVIVAAWLACACWPRRSVMTWILLAMLILTHIAIFLLATSTPL